jgi:Mycobacteriophage tail assembly protein
MAQFTLDNIRDAAEAKYGSMDIPVGAILVRLLNPLRLTKEKRSALIAAQKDLEAEEKEGVENIDQVEVFRKILRLIAENEIQAEALIAELGDDLALLASVFEMYSEGTQAGEATASQG